MLRPLAIVFAAGLAMFGATAAHAETRWSIGINLPVVVPSGGYYVQEPAPVYYQPAPAVRYAPVYDVPRYASPPPVVYAPEVQYSEPQRVYQVPYRGWRGDQDGHWGQRRDIERARWERAHHEREGHRDWDRDGRRGGEAGGWSRD